MPSRVPPLLASLVSAFLVVFLTLSCASTRQSARQSSPSSLDAVVAQGKRPEFSLTKTLGGGTAGYTVRIHSEIVAPLLRESYAPADLDAIQAALEPTLAIPLDARGLAKAADRVAEGEKDPTNYDAIWVRDSLWVYLGLKTRPSEAAAAKQLLLTLSDYFASADQMKRLRSVIQKPSLIEGENGPMNVVHIRFDGRSPSFQDVQENGQPQRWNHKQNDALGLYLDLMCRALASGEMTDADVTPERMAVLQLLPAYFAAVRFHQMADAGAWEEIERINTSSIALVTSGLERLAEITSRPTGPSAKTIQRLAKPLDRKTLARLIDQGYTTVRAQIKAGGESPSYAKTDPRFRTSDAALLNLIYPAQLKRLQKQEIDQVLKTVEPLIGEVGIKRYLKDSYQSGNYWFVDPAKLYTQPATLGSEPKTDDTSSAQDFLARGQHFIEGSEAQWFFDSWYSVAMSTLSRRYKDAAYAKAQVKFLNRALAQVTGGTLAKPVLGADGKPVAPRALPESYNTVVAIGTGERAFAPSPITPLNWAKASLRLALQEMAANRK